MQAQQLKLLEKVCLAAKLSDLKRDPYNLDSLDRIELDDIVTPDATPMNGKAWQTPQMWSNPFCLPTAVVTETAPTMTPQSSLPGSDWDSESEFVETSWPSPCATPRICWADIEPEHDDDALMSQMWMQSNSFCQASPSMTPPVSPQNSMPGSPSDSESELSMTPTGSMQSQSSTLSTQEDKQRRRNKDRKEKQKEKKRQRIAAESRVQDLEERN